MDEQDDGGCGVEVIEAPWDEFQVKAANDFQAVRRFHPYTCGNDSRHELLVATQGGWRCPTCGYQQDWSHAFVLNRDWDLTFLAEESGL